MTDIYEMMHGYNDPAALLPASDADKPWLVGESNPYGADPYYALYPDPPGCSGHRLCRLVLRLDPDEYLERFVRKNLLALGRGRRWSLPLAREAAADFVRRSEGAPFVLLGARVAAAFGLTYAPFSHFGGTDGRCGVVLPHPSGLSRGWNAPGAFDRAREMILGLCPPEANP